MRAFQWFLLFSFLFNETIHERCSVPFRDVLVFHWMVTEAPSDPQGSLQSQMHYFQHFKNGFPQAMEKVVILCESSHRRKRQHFRCVALIRTVSFGLFTFIIRYQPDNRHNWKNRQGHSFVLCCENLWPCLDDKLRGSYVQSNESIPNCLTHSRLIRLDWKSQRHADKTDSSPPESLPSFVIAAYDEDTGDRRYVHIPRREAWWLQIL